MELKSILAEALRQWEEFQEERKEYTLQDYNNFILEIGNNMEDEIARR